MRKTWATCVLGVAILVPLACSESNGGGTDTGDGTADGGDDGGDGSGTGDGGDDSGGAGEVPTFWEDVAPLLARECQQCHRPDGAGPFPLMDYEETVTMAESVQSVTEHRIMPPYLADASGACTDYKDPRWLTDDEIATIKAWYEGGMPEGDPANAPEPPEPLPHLGDDATHTVGMEMGYSPDESLDDDYRCFLIDLGLTETMYVTDFEVVPGDPNIVHHVIIYAPTDANAASAAADLDAADPDYGYTCFGDAGVDSDLIAGWAPGTTVSSFPEGTGVQLDAGIPVVMQVHYNLKPGYDEPDQTRVDLKLTDSIGKQLIPFFYADPAGLQLQPGDPEASQTVSMRLNQLGLPVDSVMLHGVQPHMHRRGSTLQLAKVPAGTQDQECLLDLLRWDFNWQLPYYFEEPVRIEGADSIVMKCVYDMSNETEPLYWGDGTEDEMCLMAMYVTLF